MGGYLINKPKERKILYKLAHSKSLWERRIAVLATFAFLPTHDFADSFAIAEILLHDPHDPSTNSVRSGQALIHKAVGWALREIGKKDKEIEMKFLNKYYKAMPRTMLRYAIEKFSDAERKHFLAK